MKALPIVLVMLITGCGAAATRSVAGPPLWDDPDRHPFRPAPQPYDSPLVWDMVDDTAFRQASRLLAVDPGGEALNVNSLDEVPNSSWFTNRIGLHPMSADDVAVGPCVSPPLDPVGPWWVTSMKAEGANPGFVVRGPDGAGYMLKFDDTEQGPRATGADTIGSRVYYAAGYTTPCNRVVFFDRSILRIRPGTKAKTWTGGHAPLTEAYVDTVLTHAARLRDGRYRAIASRWLEGKPLGAWRFNGTRDDDPNDIVPHQDRRELRGLRLLAAWLDDYERRDGNTLAVFVPVGNGYGFVQHDLLDFGACFGQFWGSTTTWSRRRGLTYEFDGYVFEDFLSLGAITRPWDTARFGPSGWVFAYYDVDRFEPERWRPEYPNPAFARMTERDGAWAARIIVGFTDEHLRRIIRSARFGDPKLEQELLRILKGRRDKILERYLTRLSPLAQPHVEAQQPLLCLRDVAVSAGIAPAGRPYSATVAWQGRSVALPVQAHADRVCVPLPATPGSKAHPVELSVMLSVDPAAGTIGPLLLGVKHFGGSDYRVVRLVRQEP